MFSLRSGDLTLQFIAPTSLVGAGSTTYEMNSNRNTTISVLFDNVRMTRSTLSDADCGAGYVYDASQNATSCAGATCNASGVDRKTCCTQCDAGYYCTGAKLPEECITHPSYHGLALTGCAGATWSSGAPSEQWCTNTGQGTDPWYKTCCSWDAGTSACVAAKTGSFLPIIARLPCGAVGSFCPPGSGRPVPVTSGYFTTPENVSKEMTRESQVRVSYLLFDTLYRCSL